MSKVPQTKMDIPDIGPPRPKQAGEIPEQKLGGVSFRVVSNGYIVQEERYFAGPQGQPVGQPTITVKVFEKKEALEHFLAKMLKEA